MRVGIRWRIWWPAVCLLLAGPAAGGVSPSFALEQVDSRQGVALVDFGDVDGDGPTEMIELASDRYHFWVRRITHEAVLGPALYQANCDHRIGFVKPIEIDSTPGMELAVAYQDHAGDSAWVEIVAGNDKDRVLCRTQAVRGVNRTDRGATGELGWDGGISRCFAVDLNNDGEREIVLSVGVGFDLYPRGVYVYRYPSGSLLWSFITAGNPGELHFCDADGDGHQEIFFKTNATANGAVVGDQSDTTADIFALDNTGRVLWRMGTGDRFEYSSSGIAVCDCDKDSVPEIYYSTLARSDDYDRQVQVLEKHRASDNQFTGQRLFDASGRFRQIVIGGAGRDSLTEVLLDNGPSLINPATLATIADGSIPRTGIEYVGTLGLVTSMPESRYVGDVHSGAQSIGLVLKKEDSLYLMDGELHLLAVYGTEYGRHVDRVSYFRSPAGGDYLAILTEAGQPGGGGNLLTVLAIVPAKAAVVSAWWEGQGVWPVGIVTFVMGIAAGIAYCRIVSRRRRRKTAHLAAYEDLLSALANFGHGQMAGRNLTRLAFLFSNLPETREKMEEILPNIRSAHEAYRSFTAGQLEAIAAHGRHIATVRTLIAELVQQTRQLNTLLVGAASAPLTIDYVLRLKDVVPRTIEAIRHDIKRLEGRMQAAFGADLIMVVPGVFLSMAGTLHRYGVKVSQITIVGDYHHLVFFPPAELAAVMEEVVANACRAMEESSRRHLSLRLEYTIDQVIIELTDTGAGLRVDDPEILFTRQREAKGKHGEYSLHHARRCIERFGGKISIRDNADGPGATVRMIFKGIPSDRQHVSHSADRR